MANKKISALDALGGTPDMADIIPITDVSDTTGSVNGTTKKATVADIIASADVEGSLTQALRGTENPHIGAFPDQPFKAIDNPYRSVMVEADPDGNLNFVVKTDASRAYLNTPSGRLELTTGVSVVEDSNEPDIEITTTSGTYSLITGDSDTKGANGLPIRQGFNAPDIGAYPAPILISGGSIA